MGDGQKSPRHGTETLGPRKARSGKSIRHRGLGLSIHGSGLHELEPRDIVCEIWGLYDEARRCRSMKEVDVGICRMEDLGNILFCGDDSCRMLALWI